MPRFRRNRGRNPGADADPPPKGRAASPWGNLMKPRTFALTIAAILACAAPALAHPHVWVTAKAELVYGPDGKVAAVRHSWTFDPAYSAFVTQGLDKNNDGTLTADELQDLAKVNTESLADFEYFTHLKANGAKQAFDAPQGATMAFENGAATLSFHLPLKKPAANKMVALEVYDPTFFVAFAMAEGNDAMKLANAPQGCAMTVSRPKPVEAAQQQRLSEAFFQALTATSDYGAGQSNKVIVACP
jgi:ABC-type uncharacterized transport system substrate-binding protein